jgi:hypothetical protein
MWKYVLGVLFLLLCYGARVRAQFTYTNLKTTIDKLQFCDEAGVAQVGGEVRANNGVYSQYHFVGMVYHFYYKTGSSFVPIGNYTIRNVSGTMQTSYTNVDAGYFDGSVLYGAMIPEDGYDPTLPLEGGLFATSFYLPVTAFRNYSGMQFAYSMEAVDQIGNTSLETGRIEFANPISGGGPVVPTIVTNTASTLCDGASAIIFVQGDPGGSIVWSNGMTGTSISVSAAGSYTARVSNGCGVSGNSNVISFTTQNTPAPPNAVNSGASNLCNGATTILFAGGPAPFTWYKDDVAYNSGNALTVNTAGTYTVKSNNICGYSAPSNPIVVTTGARPPAPVIATNVSTPLCPGATAQVYVTNPSAAVTWNTGQTGPSIEVTTAGSFYATQATSCGTSLQSNVITFTTNSIAPAPTITSSNGTGLCNGSSTTLSTTPSAGGTIYWSTGATGNSITVSAPGAYSARESTDCGFSPYSNVITITTGAVPPTPTVTPPGNFLLCNGESATFTASGANITWSNGVVGNTMTTAVAGTYYANDRNACGNSANSNAVVITAGNCPTPSPGTSFFVCPGALKTLDAGAGYETYSWNNGETAQKISVGPGNYAVTVTKNGCSATSVMVTVGYYTVVTPVINPSGPLTFCNGGSVTLTSSLGMAYAWSNGAVTNPVTVTTPGTYYVTVTDANGCQATSANTDVVVNPLPTASIAGTTSVCQNSVSPTILFTGNNALKPYTFFYKINGGSTLTVTTTSGNSVSVSVPTNVFGVFTYELVGVQESSSTTCYNAASGTAAVTVNELPNASIAGTSTVCKNSAAPSVTFTGSGGVAPYTFTYSINGGTSQTVTTTSGNTVSVSVPTSTPGTYAYTLISVKESSGTTCSNTASGTATITVRDLPNANIAGATAVCQFAATPLVTFTGSNGVAPYTFSYRINGSGTQTVTTTTGNSIAVNVPTNTAGSFVYTLLSVSESGTATCANTASGSVEVIVNAQPANAIIAAPNTHLCNGETGTIAVINWHEGFTYTWYKDGVSFTTTSAQTISVTLAGSYTVMTTSPEGCSAPGISNAVVLTVGTISAPVITGKLKVCEGGRTKLLLSPSDVALVYEKILWTHLRESPPLLYDSVNNTKSFSAAAGQYQILVKREGCVDSTRIAVTANDTEVPAGELKIFPNSIPYGGKATITAEVNNVQKFEWDFGDGRKAVTASGTLEQVFFTTKDTVQVRLHAVSETNCQTDFTVKLVIGKPAKPIIIDQSFAGNLKDWNFFPVPFSHELKLSVILNRNEKVRLDLFTADGSWVRAYEFSGRKGENLFQLHELGSLAIGVVYFVTGIYNGVKHFDKIYKY